MLDLVLTTNVDPIDNAVTVVVGEPFCDHDSMTFTLNSAPYISRISKKFIYAFNKADWSHLRSLFQYSPWDLTVAGEDINVNWTTWKDIFFAVVDDCIPKYRQNETTDSAPVTKDLMKLCRKKKNLFKKAKMSGRDETWTTYRALTNSWKKKCNSAKWQHLKKLTEKLKIDNDPKPYWNYTTSKRKGTKDLLLLKKMERKLLTMKISLKK